MKRAVRGLAAVLVLAALVYAGRGWLLPPIAAWLDVGQEPRPSKYVLALPGDANVRPYVAAALVNACLADRMLVIENAISPEVADGIVPPNDEVTRRILELRGIPPEKITVVRGDSDSTFADASQVKTLLNTDPQARVTVVTSFYHTRRSRWVFRHVLGKTSERVALVSAPVEDFDPAGWWQYEDGFLLVTAEYVKLFLYWLRYGNGTIVIAGLVVAAAALAIWRRRHRRQSLFAPRTERLGR